MQIAWITSYRCNCLRHKIGAVIVQDKHVVSTGYNGTPRGMKECNEGGCERCNDKAIPSNEKLDQCICLHAEESALLEAGHKNSKGGILYTTHMPCIECSKKIINAEIHTVYYVIKYPEGNKFLKKEIFKHIKKGKIQRKETKKSNE
eukprot:Phypoly_transcript_12095.p1 GENE.Phypoly_transcript_12095~~Phypoly_transcript_12095.p1  ORF type:complete len:147 (+),score=21.40 Phypoly_transcript_12095:501-941(+)